MGIDYEKNKTRIKFRLLRADEIEIRPSVIKADGLSLLLYKNARVDQNILDETFGMFGWKKSHSIKNNEVYCVVAIKFDGEWIEKEEVGTSSFSEPAKSAVSDSFKRCCACWGVGRALYSSPFIWVTSDKVTIRRDKERFVTNDKFYVKEIGYDEREVINKLVIVNQKKEVVYSFGITNKQKQFKANEKLIPMLRPEQQENLRREMVRTGVSEEMVCERFKIKNIQQLDQNLYKRAMDALGKSKNAA